MSEQKEENMLQKEAKMIIDCSAVAHNVEVLRQRTAQTMLFPAVLYN